MSSLPSPRKKASATSAGSPVTQSKTQYDYDDDSSDDDSSDDNEKTSPYTSGGKLDFLTKCDQNLRWVIAEAAPILAKQWRPQVVEVKPSDLESHRPKFNTEKYQKEVLKRLVDDFRSRSSKGGTDVSEPKIREIEGQVHIHIDDIMNHIIDLVFKPIIDDQTDDGPTSSPEARRKKLNHIMRLVRQHVSHYALLGVQPDASTGEISAAWKKISLYLHPDRNPGITDRERGVLTEHSQLVNNARDILVDDQKRKTYDRFLKHSPPPEKEEVFDEAFASNAFDESDSDSENEDLESSEDEDSQSYPDKDDEITKLHDKMTRHLKAFFAKIEGGIDKRALAKIGQVNGRIEKVNEEKKRPLTLYKMPKERFSFYQFAQRRIAVNYSLGYYTTQQIQKETQWLRNHFTRTAAKRFHQWPTQWTKLLMEPLYETLGLSREEKATEEKTNEGKASEAKVTEEDTKMEDAEPARPLQEIRPGFTILGDKILGYQPLKRRDKVTKETAILAFQVFIQVPGVNPLKMASGTEVGDAAILAYHQRPEEEKNNIKENAVWYSTIPPTEFVKIVGVAWKGTPSTRLPNTYVWVDLRNYSTKSHIMTRSTFRQWVGTDLADKYIDCWLVDSGIVPDWAQMGYATDPRNETKYLSLTYPAPRQTLSTRYELRPRVQPSTTYDNQIHDLTDKFDRMMAFLVEDRKEARQERQQQFELMTRLLEGPRQ